MDVNDPMFRDGFWTYKLDTFVPKGLNLRDFSLEKINKKKINCKLNFGDESIKILICEILYICIYIYI